MSSQTPTTFNINESDLVDKEATADALEKLAKAIRQDKVTILFASVNLKKKIEKSSFIGITASFTVEIK
jgi:indole-3-glycerol phosphate synthase